MPDTELLYYVTGLPFHRVLGREKSVALLDMLVNEFNMNVNKRNINGETPLHGAVSYGEVEMTRLLLNAGANRDARGGCIDDGTPLLLSAFFGMLDCASVLVDEYGAALDDAGIAAAMGRNDTLKQLLTASPSQTMSNRVLTMAAMNGQVDSAEIALDAGADIDSVVYNDITPLHWAATDNGTIFG